MSIDASEAFNNNGTPIALLTIVTDSFHAVFKIQIDEIDLFSGVLEAAWEDRKSLQIGHCSGSSAFWCSNANEINILIGHDDESWSICFTLPHSALSQISDALDSLRKRLTKR